MTKKVDRRDYVKYTGAGVAAVAVAIVGYSVYNTMKPISVPTSNTTLPFTSSTQSLTSTSNTIATSSSPTTPTPTKVNTTTQTVQSSSIQSDIIEVPYAENGIEEFDNESYQIEFPLSYENIWHDLPSKQYTLVDTYTESTENSIPPIVYYRYDDKWLELFLDVPSDTQFKQDKNYTFIFDTKSQYTYVPGAPNVYQFEVYFKSEKKLAFGEVACLDGVCKRPIGRWFNKKDYRYRWSFGQSPHSSKDHVMINILLAMDTLTKYSNIILTSSDVNDSFHLFKLAPLKENGYIKKYFSDNLKVY